MVFLRSKEVKGNTYLYLVENKWNSKTGSPQQKIIQYLGESTKVGPTDIALPFRHNSKIIQALSLIKKNNQKRKNSIEKINKIFYNNLIDGNLNKALKTYCEFTKNYSISSFYQNVLRQTMYKIGEDWEKNKVSVATEHVSSNIAHDLVTLITKENFKPSNKNKILILTPVGEEHNLGCQVIESFLTIKGYKVYNISPAIPSQSAILFIEQYNPEIILISVTLQENIKNTLRLIDKLKIFNIPIVIGGQAFIGSKKRSLEADIFDNISLDEILKFLKIKLNEKSSKTKQKPKSR